MPLANKLKWRGHTTTCGTYRIQSHEDEFGKMWYAQEKHNGQWYPVSQWWCNRKSLAKGLAQEHFGRVAQR